MDEQQRQAHERWLHSQLYRLATTREADAGTDDVQAQTLHRMADYVLAMHEQRAAMAEWQRTFARDRIIMLGVTLVLLVGVWWSCWGHAYWYAGR